MKLTHIPVSEIIEGENVFEPLKEKEFKKLVLSIQKNGILHPLIVKKQKDGKYLLLSGYNRIRAARMLNIDEVPCMILDGISETSARFDTDIYRRHLSREQIKWAEKRKINMEMKEREKLLEKLIPELRHLYEKGMIAEEMEKSFAHMKKELQEKMVQEFASIVSLGGDEQEIYRLRDEIMEKEKRIAELKGILQQSNIEKKRMEEALKRKIEELEEKKLKADAEVRKEYEKDIKEYQKNLQDMSRAIQEKDRELEKLREEKESLVNQLGGKEAEVKAAYLKMREYYQQCVSWYQKCKNPETLRAGLRTIMAYLEAVDVHITSHTWKKDPEFHNLINQIRKKIDTIEKNYTERIDELLENQPEIPRPSNSLSH